MRITDFIRLDIDVDFDVDDEIPEKLQNQVFATEKLRNFIRKTVTEALASPGIDDELVEIISDEYEYCVSGYTISAD